MDIGISENVLITNNKVSTIDIGIHLSPGVTNGIVAKNEVYIDNLGPSESYGIVFNTVSDCVAVNNLVHGGGWGMWAMWSDRILIKDNEFSPKNIGGVCGIYLSDIEGSFVTGNKVIGDVSAGICLDQGSTSNTIFRNTIAVTGDLGDVGIVLTSDTFGNLVKNNRISGVDVPIKDDSGLNTVIP